MKELQIIVIVIIAFVILQLIVGASNPCSQFSQHPELCSSDGVRQ